MIRLQEHMNCQSMNIVYLVACQWTSIVAVQYFRVAYNIVSIQTGGKFDKMIGVKPTKYYEGYMSTIT
jgi:hypothetical protein